MPEPRKKILFLLKDIKEYLNKYLKMFSKIFTY